MRASIIEQLANFAATTDFSELPSTVAEECKRDILDSIGCALAAAGQSKGEKGIACGLRIGGTGGPATIIGTGQRTSVFGAAFANAELISTLDADSVLVPGHVSPYVLPGAFAVSEAAHRSGRDLIAAVAVSHEMSYRFGISMNGTREYKDGKAATAAVVGYSSTIFGATASASKLKGLAVEQIANALAIAAAISPVNAHGAWLRHAPPSTIKYLLAGALAQSALTASEMGEVGHRGDLQLLDDVEFGYPRFIGSTLWTPQQLTDGLGQEWRFPGFQMYKPYPHCRVMHAPLDILIDLVQKHELHVDEIDSITAYGEGWAYVLPSFVFREIREPQDAQFSFAHGLAVAAHRIPPGPMWQDPKVVFDPSVMKLMGKVRLEVHPDSANAHGTNPSSRPSRVEIRARGQVFAGDRMFPKGTPSSDGQSYMSTEELVCKFRNFVDGLVSPAAANSVIDSVLNLEKVDDFGAVMQSALWNDGARRL
ncbi:MmgE/PrpD family protein [Caballeronia zhejiangensis]|uniref:MmgE/PrpD family protein n=1 Tax=Caballeronia zhejiangensis TaxID=871203 RepID=UPI001EF408DE|nr:MmgE/PrpD family protein [Caballeronia zhejiangensis]MCG7400308.1 MmgE/PrpD family protein [Caballeronia zhejiangensis]